MRQEWVARSFVIFLLAIVIAIPAWSWVRNSQTTVVHARMAETGGWTPENLSVEVGKPLHLRLTSDDVTHSFAIGQSDQPAVDVIPGEMSEVTLVFDKPGKYTFYCTRWCSVNHWRMRGVIEVTGTPDAESGDDQAEENTPLYIKLGIDIDATPRAEVVPGLKPSALRGALLEQKISTAYLSRDYYLSHTPVQLWQALRAEAAYQNLTDQEVWDLVAWVWALNATPQEREQGQQLYSANCAACHGEQGGGNGVFADLLAQADVHETDDMLTGQTTIRPVDFTDPVHMLAVSPARLQGKILRGGMGTGMPYWGPIFNEDQIWALVAYLWTFQFDMEEP
jgi:mono/diheme cytochrome c family protein/plastocyanin